MPDSALPVVWQNRANMPYSKIVMAERHFDDPVLKRFRSALSDLYGDRIERIVLFGSRARGDAQKDSDYDVAVFLRDLHEPSMEFARLADAETDVLLAIGSVVNALPFPAGAYRQRTGFMHELRRDGLDL